MTVPSRGRRCGPSRLKWDGKKAMGKNKGLEAFKDACRAAFTPVLTEHGFREERLPNTRYINEYQIRWANEKTRIIVEGINWGMNIDVRLASVDETIMEYKSYAFDDLLTIRDPTFQSKDGQLAQMEQYAELLAEHAEDVLSGNHRIFPKLAAAIRRRV